MVGMDITPKRRAVSGLSSTLSLATDSLPVCSSAISPRMGAIILQGPHHSAQKSTMTGSDAEPICSSNVASVRVLMLSAIAPHSHGGGGVSGRDGVSTNGAGGAAVSVVALILEPAFGVDGGHAARS